MKRSPDISHETASAGSIVLSIVIAILVGTTVGLGLFTFGYARGASYLVDDPNACANCHVMRSHLDAWVKSSHSKVASCNDCHAPHSFVPKYYSKARNGFLHSLAFTTGDFEQHFRINDFNRAVTESACRECHAELAHAIAIRPVGNGEVSATACIRCHATVGHDR
jgi:cytochrome c nitrite reductase small subunit